MEAEEMAKHVDTCYKNILEKFNPGARQLINAGKSYLKALHGAAAAAKIYLESLSRVAKQAQQGTCGGTADIGIALQQMIDVQREIQSQQLNTLKAFYVDLLVPLESNLEKDTKVVQSDHKKFNQQYRNQYEIYSKAASQVKKHTKKSAVKNNRSSASYDKEIKHLQAMEEEKSKMDAFCELSLKNAIAQERKRYGFVLERQTSLTKHWLAHYGKGAALLEKHLDGWQETAKAREYIPENVEFLLGHRNQHSDDNLYTLPRTPELTLEDESDQFSLSSHMRKSHSLGTAYIDEDVASLHEAMNTKLSALSAIMEKNGTTLSKSKSEFNLSLSSSPHSAIRTGTGKGTVRALYAYLSSGEHQMSFLEGDLITVLGEDPISFHDSVKGEKSKGWHYGENLRTGKRGWFPLAYTEQVKDTDVDSGLGLRSQLDSCTLLNRNRVTDKSLANVDAESSTSGNSSASTSSGHNVTLRSMTLNKSQSGSNTLRPISLIADHALFNKVPGFSKLRKSRSAFAERILCPAPTPSPPAPPQVINAATCPASSAATAVVSPSNTPTSILSPFKKAPPPPPRLSIPPTCQEAAPNSGFSMTSTDLSLRSSNDSGFVNETANGPPPAPEVDYSDEESPKLALQSPMNLNGWLIYKSTSDIPHMIDNPILVDDPVTTTMTLDRPKVRKDKKDKLNCECYPPVLGYLATLTRSKTPSQEKIDQCTPPPTTAAATTTTTTTTDESSPSMNRSSNSRKSFGIFTKNTKYQFSPTGYKTRTKSTPSKLKSVLLRSRSRDSIFDLVDQSILSENLWQYKSSVPVYVGWRPPMPLPRECNTNRKTNSSSPSAKIIEKATPPLRSKLNARKFASEPDLVEVESEYSAIDSLSRLPLLPSLPPTLPFLTPVLSRSDLSDNARLQRSLEHRICTKNNGGEMHKICLDRCNIHETSRCATNRQEEISDQLKDSSAHDLPHTLPRQKIHSSASHSSSLHSSSSSLHVKFAVDKNRTPGCNSQLLLDPVMTNNKNVQRQAIDIETANENIGPFMDYSLSLRKRLHFAEGSSNLDEISETTGNRCSPWYDLWGTDSSVQVCEIAQL